MKKRPKAPAITQSKRDSGRKEKIKYRLFIASIVMFLLYNPTRPDIIGHDLRHTFFFVLMPILGGMWILGFRQAAIVKTWKSKEDFGYKIIATIFDTIVYLLFSFLSFGLLGQIVWDTANRTVIKNEQTETIFCPIDEFGSHGKHGRHAHVGFLFNGHYEQLNIDDETKRIYRNADADGYNVQLVTKKGLWNHRVVLSYLISEK